MSLGFHNGSQQSQREENTAARKIASSKATPLDFLWDMFSPTSLLLGRYKEDPAAMAIGKFRFRSLGMNTHTSETWETSEIQKVKITVTF